MLFDNSLEALQKKDATYFAVTIPLKFLAFREQYSGICKVTSNFGNTGKEEQSFEDSVLPASSVQPYKELF